MSQSVHDGRMEQTTTTVPVFTLGDRLRKSREVAGLTQTELANRLGIGRRSVSRYEDDEKEPNRSVVMAWSMTTGISLAWLTGGDLTHNLTDTECYTSGSRLVGAGSSQAA